MVVLRALLEGFFAAVLAGGVLVWFYDRHLANLRESYVKKAAALGLLPLAAAIGGAHTAALLAGLPVYSAITWLGAPVFVYALWRGWKERMENRSAIVTKCWSEDAINYRRFPGPVAGLLKLLSPINQATRMELVRHEVLVPDLHADMEGYRILFLTDFHVHPTLRGSYFRKLARLAIEEAPDAIFLGGDFVSKPPWREDAERLLHGLAEHPRVLAVRGNHDFWTRPSYFSRMLRDWGVELLSNDVTLLERGEGGVAVVGLEDPYIPLTSAWEAELRAQLEDLEGGDGPLPRIGLVHTPETYRRAGELGCCVAMAGHSHGGQIRLPLFGTTIGACPVPKRLAYGRSQLNGMTTLTSNGLGVFFPVRFLCPPQMVEVVLKNGG